MLVRKISWALFLISNLINLRDLKKPDDIVRLFITRFDHYCVLYFPQQVIRCVCEYPQASVNAIPATSRTVLNAFRVCREVISLLRGVIPNEQSLETHGRGSVREV